MYHFPYSDSEWRKISHQDKQRLGLTFKNDGEFYMNFNRDFVKYFGEVEIVHKTPEKMLNEQKSSTKYDVMYFQGAWTSQTAGGCGNDTIGISIDFNFLCRAELEECLPIWIDNPVCLEVKTLN